jgi:hypothetical protein
MMSRKCFYIMLGRACIKDVRNLFYKEVPLCYEINVTKGNFLSQSHFILK